MGKVVEAGPYPSCFSCTSSMHVHTVLLYTDPQCTLLCLLPSFCIIITGVLQSCSWNYLSIAKPRRKKERDLWPVWTLTDGCWWRLMTKRKPLIWVKWKRHHINQNFLLFPLLFFHYDQIQPHLPALHSLRITALCFSGAALAVLELFPFNPRQVWAEGCTGASYFQVGIQ